MLIEPSAANQTLRMPLPLFRVGTLSKEEEKSLKNDSCFFRISNKVVTDVFGDQF